MKNNEEKPGAPKPPDEGTKPKSTNTLFPKEGWIDDEGIAFSIEDLIFMGAMYDELTNRRLLRFMIDGAELIVKEPDFLEYQSRVFQLRADGEQREEEVLDICFPIYFLIEEGDKDIPPMYCIEGLLEGLDIMEAD